MAQTLTVEIFALLCAINGVDEAAAEEAKALRHLLHICLSLLLLLSIPCPMKRSSEEEGTRRKFGASTSPTGGSGSASPRRMLGSCQTSSRPTSPSSPPPENSNLTQKSLRVKALKNHSKRSKKHMSMRQHQNCRSFDLPKEFHRVVLMSATDDIARYRDFFKDLGRGERVEVIAIPSAPQHSVFQRKVMYLEQKKDAELLALLRNKEDDEDKSTQTTISEQFRYVDQMIQCKQKFLDSWKGVPAGKANAVEGTAENGVEVPRGKCEDVGAVSVQYSNESPNLIPY